MAKRSQDPLFPLTLHFPVNLRQAVTSRIDKPTSLSAYVNTALKAHFARAGATT